MHTVYARIQHPKTRRVTYIQLRRYKPLVGACWPLHNPNIYLHTSSGIYVRGIDAKCITSTKSTLKHDAFLVQRITYRNHFSLDTIPSKKHVEQSNAGISIPFLLHLDTSNNPTYSLIPHTTPRRKTDRKVKYIPAKSPLTTLDLEIDCTRHYILSYDAGYIRSDNQDCPPTELTLPTKHLSGHRTTGSLLLIPQHGSHILLFFFSQSIDFLH